MLWSIVSNAFHKSVKTIPFRRQNRNFLWFCHRGMTNKCLLSEIFKKPDWYLYRTLLSDIKFVVWLWIIRSITLEISGSIEMGLRFFGSVLKPFLYKGLIFPTLHFSGKEASLMEISQILAIGIHSIIEPSLRNLPTRLSTPAALLVLNSFIIFRIDTELTFSNLSLFSRKLIPLYTGALMVFQIFL